MTQEQLRTMLQSIVVAATNKIKTDFDALPPEMSATDALNQVLELHLGEKLDNAIFRTAKQYAIPDIGTEGVRAYVKAVSMPADKAKSLNVSLELENTLDNRMTIAKLDGAAINIYCAQLDIETYANRDDQNDGQEELDLDGEDNDSQEEAE